MKRRPGAFSRAVQQRAQNARAAAQIQRAADLYFLLIQPSKQLFPKDTRILVPTKFIVHATKQASVHELASLSPIGSIITQMDSHSHPFMVKPHAPLLSAGEGFIGIGLIL